LEESFDSCAPAQLTRCPTGYHLSAGSQPDRILRSWVHRWFERNIRQSADTNA